MPRVTLNNLAYHEKDLKAYIRNECKTKKVSQKVLAEKLGTTQQNFSYMLTNLSFKPGQLMMIFKELDTPDSEIIKLMKI